MDAEDLAYVKLLPSPGALAALSFSSDFGDGAALITSKTQLCYSTMLFSNVVMACQTRIKVGLD